MYERYLFYNQMSTLVFSHLLKTLRKNTQYIGQDQDIFNFYLTWMAILSAIFSTISSGTPSKCLDFKRMSQISFT